MTILPDGRWRLSGPEINAKVWEKIKNWVLQPDGRHMVPNFPPCRVRTLVATCLPCGKLSSLNYNCEKYKMLISVAYCQKCASKGENEIERTTETSEAGTPTDDLIRIRLPGVQTDLLGTEPKK